MRIHHKTIEKIRKYALCGGGIYRMNVKSATCYAFTILPKGSKNMDGTTNNNIDFKGGWDWMCADGSILAHKDADGYIRLSDGAYIKNKKPVEQ